MNTIIYSLFVSIALRMTVITLFVMLIKLIFREKLSAAAHCAVWSVLPVQTLFCMADIKIPSKASIYNAIPNIDMQTTINTVQAYDFRNLIAALYIIGVLVLALWYAGVYVIHCIRVLKTEQVKENQILIQLDAVKKQLGINKKISLRYGGYAHTLLNTIIIPKGYNSDELNQILIHELCHYKHKDNLKLWIAVGVICLNWFNPIIWWAFMRLRLDIEMYCDDSVIKLDGSRKEYARVLVKTANNNIRFIPGTSGVANGTNEVSKRVRRIAAWKKKKPIWLVAAMFAMLCVSCLCLTNAATKAVETVAPTVVKTPDAVEGVSEMIDAVLPNATQSPTAKPTEAPRAAATQKPIIASAPIQSPNPTPVPTPVPISENEIQEWQSMGERTSVSANGSKETYTRDDGSTVILQYNDGELQTGYIIEGD